MAIDSNYSIKADFWKPVDLEGDELSAWIKSTTLWKPSHRSRLNGAEILDPNGKRVGVFFSKFDNLITKFEADSVIQVYPPSYKAGTGMGGDSKDRND
jgi:hypothetical protein